MAVNPPPSLFILIVYRICLIDTTAYLFVLFILVLVLVTVFSILLTLIIHLSPIAFTSINATRARQQNTRTTS
ncbi:hypothetical protein JB92DRAFT_2877779 [Gautieria morchelliformis]|nr:hypothetical protein JB92DRAFT_2877779 [Gautieria morchelliformis]